MPKTPNTVHEMRPYMEGSTRSHVYRPGPESASKKSSLISVSEGYSATPDEYLQFGRSLAALGYTVIIPNCNRPAPGSTSTNAFEVRADVSRYATEELFDSEEGLTDVVFAGHSMAAAVQARMMAHPPDVPVSALVSVNGAGLSKLDIARYVYDRKARMTKGMLRAVGGVLVNIVKNPGSLPDRCNAGRLLRELAELCRLEEGHNLEYYEKIIAAGGRCLELYGTRDNVIDAERTLELATPVVGPSNVVSIHPLADHYGPQNHPRHVAKVMDGALSCPSDMPDLGLAS